MANENAKPQVIAPEEKIQKLIEIILETNKQIVEQNSMIARHLSNPILFMNSNNESEDI